MGGITCDKTHRNHATHAVADDDERRPADVLRDMQRVTRHALGRVRSRRVIAEAAATIVEHDALKFVDDKRRFDARPASDIRRKNVKTSQPIVLFASDTKLRASS